MSWNCISGDGRGQRPNGTRTHHIVKVASRRQDSGQAPERHLVPTPGSNKSDREDRPVYWHAPFEHRRSIRWLLASRPQLSHNLWQ